MIRFGIPSFVCTDRNREWTDRTARRPHRTSPCHTATLLLFYFLFCFLNSTHANCICPTWYNCPSVSAASPIHQESHPTNWWNTGTGNGSLIGKATAISRGMYPLERKQKKNYRVTRIRCHFIIWPTLARRRRLLREDRRTVGLLRCTCTTFQS